MLRLSPPGYQRFLQCSQFEASYAGGEANVAVSLAQFGIAARFVSKVPQHAIGQAAVNQLRRYGVETECMVRGGERLGLYYCEKGASQRPSQVLYDRSASAFALTDLEEWNWDEIFAEANWFHWTGITPALGGNLPALCLRACQEAKKRGITVSCDLNYRKKLWTTDQARKVMGELLPYVDVCIANEEDAKDVFGIEATGTNVERGELNREGYIDVARQLQSRFDLKYVAITLRTSLSASVNDWSGMLFDGASGQAVFAPTYRIQLVDRVGGGDSFAAGMIYSLLQGWEPSHAISFAVAASCLKQTMEQDFNLAQVSEVESLVAGNTSGRVQR